MKKLGFTIVELSLVLIVVALLLAGVLGGQYLIEVSKIQSVIKDIQLYSSIHTKFQDQFKQLPGDMDNAFTIWGTQCAPDTGKCNGDGDSTYDNGRESYLAWKHMELSKLVENNFSDITLDNQADCEVGTRFPETGLSGISFSFNNPSSEAEARTSTVSDVRTALMRISLINFNCDGGGDGALTGEQIRFIDEKMDDSTASGGKLITSEQNDGCTDSVTDGDDADYVNNPSANSFCLLWYKLKTF